MLTELEIGRAKLGVLVNGETAAASTTKTHRDPNTDGLGQ